MNATSFKTERLFMQPSDPGASLPGDLWWDSGHNVLYIFVNGNWMVVGNGAGGLSITDVIELIDAYAFLFSGNATILSGQNSVDVAITDLTANAQVVLTQKVSSLAEELTTFAYLAAAGTLTILSGAAAPAAGWTVFYGVRSL